MNFKTHKKGLIALALVFFMLAPMLMASTSVHAGTSAQGSFSVVKDAQTLPLSGSNKYNPTPTTITSVTIPSTTALGTLLGFDIVINNAANVNGWALPTVAWNPAVLTCTGAKEGPFLQDNAAGTGTAFLVGAIGSPAGTIGGGIADAIQGTAQSPDSTAVVCTIYFTVVGYGTSPVSITGTGSNQAYLHTAPGTTDPQIPVATTDASVTQQAPAMSISLLNHATSGTPTGNTFSFPSTTNPIGSYFSVDAYLQGATGNIWAWSLNVAWNPAAIHMTTCTEGAYLSSAENTGTSTLYLAGSIDNTKGQIDGGVNDAFSTLQTDPSPAGVLMTMTFQVVGFGNSAITLTAGTPAALLGNQATPTPLSTQPTLNSFAYSWTPATPTNPTVIAAVTSGPFGPNSDNTFTGTPITIGATGTPGINTEPPAQSCPITSYTWSITLVGASSPIVETGSVLTLTSTQVGLVTGSISITLTVTAPSPTGTPAPGYTGTASTTISILVQTPTPGGVVDVWTTNGGQGPNVDCTSFGPQQMVNLYAYVSYNGAPVVDKTVTFAVSGPAGTTYVTGQTDQSGIATAQYRLPWQDSNPASYFGEMTVSTTVDVAQVVLSDSCHFYYGYQLQVNSVVITNGDTTTGTPTFNRYAMAGADSNAIDNNVVDATVSVTNTMWNSQQFWLSAVIYDNNNVPVAQFLALETIGAGTPISGTTNTWQNTNTQTYQIMLTIPTWAYVGTANIYVNIFNSSSATSLQNPLAWSPQVQAPLAITANYPNNVIVPSTTQPTQVLNVVYNVQNDEDTGLSGYWALDNYVKTVQVWSLGSNNYEIVATYKGTFTTYTGALSPEAGTPETTTSGGATGTITGEYIGTFTSANINLTPNNPLGTGKLSNYGNIGTYNFGGLATNIAKGTYALQGTGNPTAFDVLSIYFPGYTNFVQSTWGWTYIYGSPGASGLYPANHIWSNSVAGNTGDIVVP